MLVGIPSKILKSVTTMAFNSYQIWADGTVIYDGDYDTPKPDGCAIGIPDKAIAWYQDNKYHRIDGPAVECASGDKFWYQNGEYHRIDGPAIEYINGTKYWFQNGKHHRIDGPAREYANGEKYWYIEGVCYFEHKYNIKMKTYHNEKEKEA